MASALKVCFMVIVGTAAFTIFGNTHASAASIPYDPSHLIDDIVFTNKSSMSVQQIQAFLANMGSGLANLSFAASCSGDVQYMQNYYNCGSSESAAQIIYDAAQAYNINPQVIMATLQKEQSLITSPNPSTSQLNNAMGYACPDSGGCQGGVYGGFFNQVDNATWQFQDYLQSMNGTYGSNTALWTSGYACAGATRYYSTGLYPGNSVTFYDDNGTAYSTLSLQTASTAALYCYTPHTYNNPGGANGLPPYGTTGLYYTGSYNFEYYFQLWFGSPINGLGHILVTQGPTLSTTSTVINSPVTATFTLHNDADAAIYIGYMAASVRDQYGNNYDFPVENIWVQANSDYTYSETRSFSHNGAFSVGLISNNWYSGWTSSWPISSSSSVSRQTYLQVGPNVILSQPPTFTSIGSPYTSYTGTFQLYNSTSSPINVGWGVISVRDEEGNNADFPAESINIPPESFYTYSETKQFSSLGWMQSFLTFNLASGGWTTSYPSQNTGGGAPTLNGAFHTGSSVLLTSGLSLNPTNPTASTPVTASFTIRNDSSQAVNYGWLVASVRSSDGSNYDFPVAQAYIPAHASYTYSQSRSLPVTGRYTSFITLNSPEYGWTTSQPQPTNSNITSSINFTTSPDVTISQASLAPPTNTEQPTTASYTLTNHSPSTINLGWLVLSVRDANNANHDFAPQQVYLAPNSSKTLNFSQVLPSGDYNYYVTVNSPLYGWTTSYPPADSGVQTSGQFTIN